MPLLAGRLQSIMHVNSAAVAIPLAKCSDRAPAVELGERRIGEREIRVAGDRDHLADAERDQRAAAAETIDEQSARERARQTRDKADGAEHDADLLELEPAIVDEEQPDHALRERLAELPRADQREQPPHTRQLKK